MEISIVILSCVILGLNPEMPVFIRLIMICNLNGFRKNKIHTYIQNAEMGKMKYQGLKNEDFWREANIAHMTTFPGNNDKDGTARVK